MNLMSTYNSTERLHSEPDPPIEGCPSSPSPISRNNTFRYGLHPNPTPKMYPDLLIHEITKARESLHITNTALQLN